MHRALVIMLLLGCFSAASQSKTFVGLRAGGQFSSAFITHTIFIPNIDTDFIQNAHAGVVVKHFNFKALNPKSLNAGFQTGVNFIQRGWQQNFTDENLDPYRINLNYLEFPIEGIIYGGKGKTKVFGTLGIYYERLLGSSEKNRPVAQLESDGVSVGVDDFYTYDSDRDPENGYGTRISFGVFSEFPFGTLQVEAFTSISFSGVFDFEDRTTQIPDQSNLYSIGLSLSYFIGFGELDF